MNAQSLFEAVCFRPFVATTRTSKLFYPEGIPAACGCLVLSFLTALVFSQNHFCSVKTNQQAVYGQVPKARFYRDQWFSLITTGQLLLVGPLDPRGGAAPFASLPCSLVHSEEDVDLERWQQWRACPRFALQHLGFEKLPKTPSYGPWTELGPLLRRLPLPTSMTRSTPFLSISHIPWLFYSHVFLHKREHTAHPIPTLLLS